MTEINISLDELPLAPSIKGDRPYGAPQLEVDVALNVNENPYPPSGKVRSKLLAAVEKSLAEINRYPDREALELRADLAKYLGFNLAAENIWVANGSNEIITQLLLAFGGPGRKLLTFSPTYSMYPEYARNTHTEFVSVPRRADFSLDAKGMLAAVEEHQPDIVLIANPNNPTGTLVPVAEIAELCRRSDAIVIIDEAYQEFTQFPEDSSLALLPRFPRLAVARTMSKAFAFAGARVGYLAASPAVVDACRIVRLPYHLSTQTQVLAQVVLANAPTMLAKVQALREECQAVQEWLRLQGLDVIPSEANFCLFGPFADRHEVWEELLNRGVLVREVGPEGYLRVSAGTPDDMAAFRDALVEVLPGSELNLEASARLKE